LFCLNTLCHAAPPRHAMLTASSCHIMLTSRNGTQLRKEKMDVLLQGHDNNGDAAGGLFAGG
jgi:hypothetical protein